MEDNKESMDGIFGGITTAKFDNPFLAPSSAYYPESLSAAFDFCRYLYFRVPVYRQVAKRTTCYFITDFEFPGEEGNSKDKEALRDYLTNILRLPNTMMDIGDEWGCYGNAFVTIYYPFKRNLIDDRGELTRFYDISMFDSMQEEVKFDLKTMTYEVPDPANKFQTKVKLGFIDTKLKDKTKIKLRILDPRNIRIQYNEISGKSRYILRFNSRIISNIKNNYLFAINDTPKEMLEAIANDQDFAFYDDEIFHFRAPVVSGLSYQNWGLPEPIANYNQIWQIMVYQKMDESVALDYMLPFRIFSAEPSSQSGDLMQNLDMGKWSSEIKKIIDARRKDKFAMHSFPFPVNYQEFGGNGKALTPKDLLEFQITNLFNCCGYPRELFESSLTVQQMPTALRLFENSFYFLYDNFNALTRWVVRKIQKYTEESPIAIRLQHPKYADNLETANIKMQLGMNGELPRSAYLGNLGVENGVDAAVARQEEDMEIQMRVQKKQEELEAKAQAEQLLEQELQQDSGTPSSDSGMGINDMEQRAQAKAQEWLSIQSEGERTKAMQATKAESFELYSMAKQIMEEMRSQMTSQAKQQISAGQ